MVKTKLPKLFSRKWLNNDEGTAYVVLYAEVEGGYRKHKEDRSVNASVEIKDCNRQITLDFYYYCGKEYKKRLNKIRLLIETLEKLEAFMKANPPVFTPRKNKERAANLRRLGCHDFDGEIEEEDTLELTQDMIHEEGSLTVTTAAVNDLPASKGKIHEASAVVYPVAPKN